MSHASRCAAICAATVAVATTGLVPAAGAAACFVDGKVATLSGRVTLVTVPPSTDPPHRGYTYPRLRLDHPACLAGEGETDNHLAIVALQPPSPEAVHAYHSGEHVTRTGKLFFTFTADQPPETAMLMLGG